MKKTFDKALEAFEKYNIVFLAALIVLYLISRYVYLGEICYYMDIDELRSAYDSVCIANGSKNIMQHPSLFSVAAALVFKLKHGLFSLKLFRLISVAGGLVGMIFSYLTVLEMTGKRSYAFLEALIVTTIPVFFISSRTGVAAYTALWIVPAAFYLLIKGMNSQKRLLYVLSALLWIAVIYTLWGENHGVSFSDIPANIMNIKALLWDDSHPFNISSTFGTIYIFSVPVIIAGIVISIRKTASFVKNKKIDASVLLWIYTIVFLFAGLITKDADTRSVCVLFFAASIFICEGLIWLCENIKGTIVVEIAVYVICLIVFSGYYFENFNSEVNNSADHEAGIVVDKSVGEAVKSAINILPGKQLSVMTDNFEGRDLMIALFSNASYSDYQAFNGQDSYSFVSGPAAVRVNTDEEPVMDGSTVYIINQAEHQDIIDYLTNQGWGNLYLKEYTVCYMQ